MRLRFFCKELVTRYEHAVHRGFTRWGAVLGREDEHTDRYNIYLCGVLRSDYQGADDCERMLREIEKVERGEQPSGKGSGNGWMTTFTREGVQIDHHTVPEWDGSPEGRFTLAEFKAALEGWQRFLELPARLNTSVEVELPPPE